MTTATESTRRRAHTDFAELWRNVEERESYWESLARLQFTSSVRAQLRARGLSQVELAGRLGWKPAQVSRALQGLQNLTLRSMVRLCRALDLRLEVCAVAEDAPFTGSEGSSSLPFPDYAASGDPTLVVAESGATAAVHPAAPATRRARPASRHRKRGGRS
jgi:transcriptional regulator with XRE-family HTH domain